MTTHPNDTPDSTPGPATTAAGAEMQCTHGSAAPVPEMHEPLPATAEASRKVPRGLTARIGTWPLQEAIWLRSLTLANRFRVIRTIDIAVHCFAERPFKAALSAAQRAVRGMCKARLLAKYRTSRFMTVYGLTERGVAWLEDRDVAAAASIRRVTDMTNPEHRLWAQFVTLCSEARGLAAMAEQELLQVLSTRLGSDSSVPQGLLQAATKSTGKRRVLNLRPDAVANESDGVTWFEVDRSARGSDRAASLKSLVLSVGAATTLGSVLRRVVVYTRTERIKNRVLATLAGLASETARHSLAEGRRRLVPVDGQQFEVWLTMEERLKDGRLRLVDLLAGHVMVQELPIWLPRVRMDGRGGFSTQGWFTDNYLPYRRPASMPPWLHPTGLLIPGDGAARVDLDSRASPAGRK